MQRPGYDKYLDKFIDSESNLIIQALEKDFKNKVEKEFTSKINTVFITNFSNIRRLDDRSPQFISSLIETLRENKSKVKQILNGNKIELITMNPDYVSKAEMEIFNFIKKELGFTFYSKHGRELHVSNDKEIIKHVQGDLYRYGEVTNTNVKDEAPKSKNEVFEEYREKVMKRRDLDQYALDQVIASDKSIFLDNAANKILDEKLLLSALVEAIKAKKINLIKLDIINMSGNTKKIMTVFEKLKNMFNAKIELKNGVFYYKV